MAEGLHSCLYGEGNLSMQTREMVREMCDEAEVQDRVGKPPALTR